MADVTKNVLNLNSGATVEKVDGAASQTIVFDRSDSKIVIIAENTDAVNPVRIKVKAGTGMSGVLGDLDVDIAVSAIAGIGELESARFKEGGSVTIEILDQDDTAFTGSVADVKLTVLELPKALIN